VRRAVRRHLRPRQQPTARAVDLPRRARPAARLPIPLEGNGILRDGPCRARAARERKRSARAPARQCSRPRGRDGHAGRASLVSDLRWGAVLHGESGLPGTRRR